MPGGDGTSVAAAVLARFPVARVVFASGYDVLPGLARPDLPTRQSLLRKPFTAIDLRRALVPKQP